MADRKLGALLQTIESQDTIIVSEISRLGRNLMQIMGILNLCMEKKIKIISIKENYELGDNINSKVLAFAFGLSAEIERNLISQRTKEALARKKAEGALLGRPKGSQSKKLKLQGKEQLIRKLLNDGYSKSDIAKKTRHLLRHPKQICFQKNAGGIQNFFFARQSRTIFHYRRGEARGINTRSASFLYSVRNKFPTDIFNSCSTFLGDIIK